MKTSAIVTILSALAVTIFAQEPPKLPDDARRVQASFVDAKKKAIATLESTYRSELEKLLDAHTKAGNLDAALAIRNELATLSGGVSKSAVAATTTENPIVGTWNARTTTGWTGLFIFEADGKAFVREGKVQTLVGKWNITAKTLKVDFGKDGWDRIDYPPINGNMSGKNSRGNAIYLEKK